ncbi:ABC transporter permease [Caldalkalibacillus mannanilyticus]|uniref:ABC transporter permease n=1 Tax=Caldalkalibacillus mannanilyticus TaxID=1418 RepID=UPI00046A48E2|nr:ABC transporter permease [Caldalkalibacillus mannanilyticus]
MILFRLARKNIQRGFTNYLLYFASMIFSIVIYFTFVSLKYDKTIQAISDSSEKISSIFNVAAVVLLIFVAVFIWYSTSFFIRKRKKEVGLYSLLGVRKKQIGRMLFYENFIMGTLAIIMGIILGSSLSRFFVSILMKVMGYEIIPSLSFSLEAIVNTSIVFTLITIITSIHGYRLIYRFTLIELFQADKQGEIEPKASLIVALCSFLCIGIGYGLALQNILESELWRSIGFMVTPLVIVVSVILGTYLFFSALTVYVLKVSKKNKQNFWRGTSFISISQLLYRIKGNARTLTIIAVLSATTLTAVGTAYSLYYNVRNNVDALNPNSFMLINVDQHITEQVRERIEQDENHELLYHESVPTVQLRAEMTNLNSAISSDEVVYTIIPNNMFNKLVRVQERKESLSLEEDEAVVLDAAYYEGLSPKYVGVTIPLKVNNTRENITFKEVKEYNVLNLYTANTTLVVSDQLFSKLSKATDIVHMEAYGMTAEDQADQLTKELQSILPNEAKLSSFYSDYSAGLASMGLLIFIGGFLGLVFLGATGSIIYFKQVTEAHADKARYDILAKIGMTKKEIKKAVSQQILFVFALPLFAGIAHSVVALTALSRFLQSSLVLPVLVCIGVYVSLYAVYYFLTVNSYYKIVTKTK